MCPPAPRATGATGRPPAGTRKCAVDGWLPATAVEPEALVLRDSRGSAAGQVMVRPRASDAGALREAVLDLAEAPCRKRRMRRLRPGLLVTVDAHGADGQPLRDPILRGWRQVTD